MTKQERAARRERCKAYLLRGGDPSAVALAATEGFHQNTSVWLGALGEALAAQKDPIFLPHNWEL